ncbi:uncharacterized protein [Argopecten irradians]|uniref:uncharacterized protein isoform X2 n=1 Tax=Argopecten irradians TaxID=31199 RepID=UPI00371C6693
MQFRRSKRPRGIVSFTCYVAIGVGSTIVTLIWVIHCCCLYRRSKCRHQQQQNGDGVLQSTWTSYCRIHTDVSCKRSRMSDGHKHSDICCSWGECYGNWPDLKLHSVLVLSLPHTNGRWRFRDHMPSKHCSSV